MNFKCKPKKFKHFFQGPKYSCSLLTRLRVEYSDLNAHRYKVGLSESIDCTCISNKPETSQHFLLQCELYTEERRTLFDQIKQFIPNFHKLPLKRQYFILIFGYEPENDEMQQINTKIMKFSQKYILSTKRFETDYLG